MTIDKTNCERFEEILAKNAPLTEDEAGFYLEHERSCPLGVHSREALERFHGLPPGSLADGRTDPLPAALSGHYERILKRLLKT